MSLDAVLARLEVLVVDDEEDLRRGLERLLKGTGANVRGAGSAEEALTLLGERAADLVLTDVRMPGLSGVDLLREVKSRWPEADVVLITGFGTIETAVSCLHAGAAHFLTKPFDNDQILHLVETLGVRAVARRAAQEGAVGKRQLIAVDPRMREVESWITRTAPLPVPVLIEGASGTGKELVARALHEEGRHPERPFVAVNCAALPDTLLESELFGYKRGAFTGAHKDHEGIFRRARGGTVFLDEVASMSLPFQGRLLRVLEERVVNPLGGVAAEPVEFRLVSATNRDLAAQIGTGEFREDLYYRLKVVTIRLPTLRERPADIPALASHFVANAARELLGADARTPELSPGALEELRAYDWPGNVRELENAVQRAVVAAEDGLILPHHLSLGRIPWASAPATEPLSYDEQKQRAVQQFQRRFVLAALERSGGNVTRAAEACGMTRAALQRILRELGIDRTAFQGGGSTAR